MAILTYIQNKIIFHTGYDSLGLATQAKRRAEANGATNATIDVIG